MHFFFFFFWWDWGLNLGLCNCKANVLLLSSISGPFCSCYFGHGVSLTIFAWVSLRTMILLISASEIAWITGVSYQCPACATH
jgi:hypothetical protein